MKVNNLFASLQGEGRYMGTPVVFVRLSGCTRACSFCDTKYHKDGTEMSIKELAKKIVALRITTVVFTGGEPLLQLNDIMRLTNRLPTYDFHLETNGDLIKTEKDVDVIFQLFDYVAISPKELRVAKRVTKLFQGFGSNHDIKVVTDLETVGADMLKYATMVMPLTRYKAKQDLSIKRRVWEYATVKRLRYSARLHVEVFGKKRGV